MFDERTILARAQHALNADNLALCQSFTQFALDSFGSFDEAALQFFRSGVVKSLPAGRTEFLQSKLVRIQESDSAKQASETSVAGERGLFCRAHVRKLHYTRVCPPRF